MGGKHAALKPSESVAAILETISLLKHGDNGSFINVRITLSRYFLYIVFTSLLTRLILSVLVKSFHSNQSLSL